jgi:hypothetical protein
MATTLPPIIKQLFDSIGLSSLTQWAANAIINGWSEDQVMIELYERPEFKDRFAGMFALKAKNKPPISINEYLAYEKSVHSLAAMWGMELTKQEVDEMIGGEISMVEAERRFDIAAAAVYESDIEERSELERMFGVNLGQQMKYWMDPKKELGTLQQQYRMAQIGGAALRTGYGQITSEQALRLTETGLSKEQALTGFGELVRSKELFTPLSSGELEITEDQQIELLAGDADVREMLSQRQRSREAEFQGGGGFAVSEQGFATGVAE